MYLNLSFVCVCVNLMFLIADHAVRRKVSPHAVLLSHQARGRTGDGNLMTRTGFVYVRPLNGNLECLTGTGT